MGKLARRIRKYLKLKTTLLYFSISGYFYALS